MGGDPLGRESSARVPGSTVQGSSQNPGPKRHDGTTGHVREWPNYHNWSKAPNDLTYSESASNNSPGRWSWKTRNIIKSSTKVSPTKLSRKPNGCYYCGMDVVPASRLLRPPLDGQSVLPGSPFRRK